MLLLLAGCGGSEPRTKLVANPPARSSLYDPKTGVSASPRIFKPRSTYRRPRPAPKGGGSYKLGKPYKVSGRWYVPRHQPNYDQTGMASWYGDDFHGRKTANGEIYDMRALTAAHPTLPLPSYAFVTNLANGRTILVRVNDRGPYARNRIIDMSRAAARALDYRGKGLTKVRVRYAGKAPLNGSDHRERRFLARQHWYKGGYKGGRRLAAAPGRPARSSPQTQPRSSVSTGRKTAAAAPAAQGRVPTWNWRPGKRRPGRRRYAGKAYPNPAPRSALGRSSRAAPSNWDGGSGRKIYVQAGVFANKDNALRLRNRLLHLGRVHMEPVPLGATARYRVSVGPVARAGAWRLLEKVAAYGAVRPRLVYR